MSIAGCWPARRADAIMRARMDLGTLAGLVAGVVALAGGGELLVRGASRLALALGLSPLVIGLTVVAFGTSAPEFAVSVRSAFAGQADLALGNVVGSNIFNVLFILGLSALVMPLVVAQRLVRLDVPIMIGVSLLLLLVALDGSVGRLDGAVLVAAGIAYTALAIRMSRTESPVVAAEYGREFGRAAGASAAALGLYLALVGAGLVLVVVGARWLVEAAVAVARGLGVSELVIGLTIVAAGTSLPEVAASVVASVRGERDIAVGNVVGSNVFNVLAVLGLSATVSPAGIGVSRAALAFDIPVMVAVAVACLPIFFTGHRIARWEGALFLAYYGAYAFYVILQAQQHDALPLLGGVMAVFVLPLTVLTLVVLAVRAARTGGGD
jgi:cation:H+ antiporter